ncbi:MAG TPA: hypothetical protein VFO16_14445 [Pseudonocardiaceae bacterium]|nr:hypothetical protein [Pseudonocardiaceae bacterium]
MTELLVAVAADGFTLYCCGPKAAPNALVARYEWDHDIDLLTIRNFDRVITARAPRRRAADVFAPEAVVWAYEGPPQHALRALPGLVHPMHPDAPVTEYPAPPGLRVPRAEQRPMTIQLPTPSDPGGLFALHEACLSWRQARWLVRVRSSGWPFHHALSRIRLRATAA